MNQTTGKTRSKRERTDADDRDPESDVVLETRALTKRFGTVTVLDGVTLAIPRGSVVAVIGPNGSGKSTLLRLLVGDLPPTEGSVDHYGSAVSRATGYLPQRATFRPRFTAAETLEFYGSLLEEPDVRPLLERVGLQAAAERRVEALSGGMRRLLGIAQAMIGEPPVVVLDEPASGLDPSMSRHVFETITEMAAREQSVVVSSHDVSLVESTADTVVVLSEGSVIDSGTPDAVRRQFQAEQLRDIFDQIGDEDGRVSVVGGEE